MLTKAKLQELDLNMLAMYCLRVAETPGADPSKIAEALDLKRAWNLYINSPVPPIAGLQGEEELPAYCKKLRQGMVDFLAMCSLDAGLAGKPGSPANGHAKGVAAGHKK
ncbi:MAG TPA: hypothetical protein VL128_12235 [Candidatus Eisenbacteria bacterium]|nr:hypothetical protein [Candidatus Eisenbacteria bacterium]